MQGGLEIVAKAGCNWTNEEGLSRLKSFIEKNYQYEASFQDDSREILNGLFSTQEAEEDGNPEEDEDLGILMELDEDQE